MSWSTYGRNRRADETAALIDAISLHTADPGAAGTANEWADGGYSRQAPVFAPADEGVASLTGPVDFTGEPATEAAFIGLWEDVEGTPTFLGAAPRSGGDAASNAAGEYSIGTLNVTATGTITA